jgi:thymidylate synthase (FAD)
MEVNLVSVTYDWLDKLYLSARTCYSETVDFTNVIITDEEQKKELIKKIVDSGHDSILEHISFTFQIKGVSRTLTHQLVRHRIASFSQKSQRYVEGMNDYIIPESIKEDGELLELYKDTISKIDWAYTKLVKSGIKKEDARYLFPNATTSDIVVTVNMRSLKNFMLHRRCEKAQWEIRELADTMRELVNSKTGEFFDSIMQPKCIVYGNCNEHNTCGGR